MQVSIDPDKQVRQKKKRVQAMCQHLDCTGVQASYGYEYDKKLIRCVKHIEEGMINLKCRQCEESTCYKRASFGQPDTKVSVTAFFRFHTLRCCAATKI
jgi:EsV-1-7 cysteine-rich motif